MVRHFLWAGVVATSVLEGSGHAGLITYVDRQQWEAAVDQSTMETVDFESFTGDVRFVPAPQGVGSVDAGPFSLSANKIVSSSENLLPNRVDVAPYFGFNNSASNYAYIFVEGDNNLQVTLTFENPVLAFGADFDRVDGAPGESLDLRAITSNGSTTLQAPDPDGFFGFVSDGDLVNQIVFQARAANGHAGGTGAGMDNAAIAFSPVATPEPSTPLFFAIVSLLGWFHTRRIATRQRRKGNS